MVKVGKVKRVRIEVNGGKLGARKQVPPRKKHSRRKPGDGQSKGAVMAKKKARKKNAQASHRPRSKSKSVGSSVMSMLKSLVGGRKTKRRRSGNRKKQVHAKTRRNAGAAIRGRSVGKMVRSAGVALVSGMAVRETTQMLLGDKNTGLIGYAGNLGMSAAAYLLAGVIGTKDDAFAAGAGGVASTIIRGWTDNATRVGQVTASPLAAIGDAGTFSARPRAERFLMRRALPSGARPANQMAVTSRAA